MSEETETIRVRLMNGIVQEIVTVRQSARDWSTWLRLCQADGCIMVGDQLCIPWNAISDISRGPTQPGQIIPLQGRPN